MELLAAVTIENVLFAVMLFGLPILGGYALGRLTWRLHYLLVMLIAFMSLGCAGFIAGAWTLYDWRQEKYRAWKDNDAYVAEMLEHGQVVIEEPGAHGRESYIVIPPDSGPRAHPVRVTREPFHFDMREKGAFMIVPFGGVWFVFFGMPPALLVSGYRKKRAMKDVSAKAAAAGG